MTVERLIKDRATSLRQLQSHPAVQYGIMKIGAVSEAAKTASAFQTLLNIRPVLPKSSDEVAAAKLDRTVWLRGSFPLQLIFSISDGEVTIEPRSDSGVLCDRQLHRILDQFGHTLQLLTEVPPQTKLDKLQLLDPYARSEIFLWNKAAPKIVEKCLHEVFRVQARTQPEAVAVEANDGHANYYRLDQDSDRLAHELQRRGVSPRKPVAFVFEKSLWAIVALLGILKAGGICIPIDRCDQHDRKAAIVSSANVGIVLTSSAEYAGSVSLAPDVLAVDAEFLFKLPEVPSQHVDVTSSPEDPAYIIFTSGSTGDPKGVILEHRCLASSLDSHARRLGWRPGCRMLQFAAHASNRSVCEIFGTLLFGGCLCIPSEEQAREPNLASFVESGKVNWALLTPSVLRTLSPSDVPGLQSVLSTGEALDAECSKIWSRAPRLFNGWGACETSMLSTVDDIPTSQYLESIGAPVGCAVWIVDPQNTGELAPIGGVGELLIEGPGVAHGYFKGETKVASPFISSPRWASASGRQSARFFRTGDLAKYDLDGSIIFVGRQSNRVKLGGQTVQLEKLESVIATCGKVKDVVAITKIAAGRTQLAAVVSLADPELPRAAVLQKLSGAYQRIVDQHLKNVRNYARSRLPSNKVPTLWLAVEQLPRTVSHTVDRAAVREWLKTQLNSD